MAKQECVMKPRPVRRWKVYGAGKIPSANARLIAAAPDLLAALEAFSESFDSAGEYRAHTAEYGTKELVRMARAAIKKAKRCAT